MYEWKSQRSLPPLRSPQSPSCVSSPRLRAAAVNYAFHQERPALIVSDPLLHPNEWVLLPNNSGERLSAAIRNSK
jgi:hypothetical protein